MRVIVSPSQLYIDPVLGCCRTIKLVPLLMQQTRLGDLPLGGCEEQDIGTAGIHFVRFTGMYGLLLDAFNLKGVQLHVQYLAKIHHYRLVDLLPQMRSEDLDQRDLEGRDFSVHEDASEVELTASIASA